jgi:hypothetical protein
MQNGAFLVAMQQRKAKDPYAPKMAMTAYLFFSAEKRLAFKKAHARGDIRRAWPPS